MCYCYYKDSQFLVSQFLGNNRRKELGSMETKKQIEKKVIDDKQKEISEILPRREKEISSSLLCNSKYQSRDGSDRIEDRIERKKIDI